MPTYDYRCDLCQERFELWQSFSEDTLQTCPVEGGPAACQAPGEGPVKKVFSKVGISFKGAGFYKNDHGANASRRKEKSESGSVPSSKSEGSVPSSKSEGSGSSSKSEGSASAGSDSSTTTKSSSSDKVSS